jgi:4-hydroxy-3-methylbut-2-enyl diphosphate reductase
VGQNYGVKAFLVNDWSDVNPAWIEDITNVGVTAGASAPEHLVEEIVAALKTRGFSQLEEVEMVEEDVRFSLPPELASAASSQLYSISR